MKKKTTKRLVLTKETVRSLEDLMQVQGGSVFSGGSCDYPCQDEFRPLTGLSCDC